MDKPYFWNFTKTGEMLPEDMPESGDADYDAYLKGLGFKYRTKFGSEYSPIQIDLLNADRPDYAYALEISAGGEGLCIILFASLPLLLLFLKDYSSLFSIGVGSEVSEMLQTVNRYLFDAYEGLEIVQRATRRDDERRIGLRARTKKATGAEG